MTTLVIEGWWWHVGGNYADPSYAIIWAEMRVIGLFCAILFAGPRLIAIPVALSYAGTLLATIPHFSFNQTLTGLEGAAFTFAGVSAVVGNPGRLKALLAVMWLSSALFDIGYTVGYEMPTWVQLNEWWGYALASTFFLAVGWQAGRYYAPLPRMQKVLS